MFLPFLPKNNIDDIYYQFMCDKDAKSHRSHPKKKNLKKIIIFICSNKFSMSAAAAAAAEDDGLYGDWKGEDDWDGQD